MSSGTPVFIDPERLHAYTSGAIFTPIVNNGSQRVSSIYKRCHNCLDSKAGRRRNDL